MLPRINAGVPVEGLCDQHLKLEHESILKIGKIFRSRMENKSMPSQLPKKFVMTGQKHVEFFLNKGFYVGRRWGQLEREMIRRGFESKVQYSNDWDGFGKYMRDYQPQKFVARRVKVCLIENLPDDFTYMNETISREFYSKNILLY